MLTELSINPSVLTENLQPSSAIEEDSHQQLEQSDYHLDEANIEFPLQSPPAVSTTTSPQYNSETFSITSSSSLNDESESLTTNSDQLSIITQLPVTAFQILNQDNLIGQQQQQQQEKQPTIPTIKPNAIVRPMNYKQIEKNSTTKKQTNNSVNVSAKHESVGKRIFQQFETFAKELDFKLRRLKKIDKSMNSSLNSSNQDSLNKRPLFVTTVPTGVFLPPLHVNRVYAFCSRPKIFATNHQDEKQHQQKYRAKRQINNDKEVIMKRMTTTKLGKQLQSQIPNGLKPISNRSTDPRGTPCTGKIMRGSNYAQPTQWDPHFAYAGLLSGKEDPKAKEAEARRRLRLRKCLQQRNQRNIIGTPPALPGRCHELLQTEKYLEELFERPPEFDVNTQTDLFLQRPPSPPYMPAKTGIDVATEIGECDLFNFDVEVQPILESLVENTVKQGLIEVLHEDELADIRKQQEEFLARREAELNELRRLEAEEIRLQAEKERRMRQAEISRELDAKMQENITASKLLQGHIANLIPEVIASLEPLTDPERKEDLEKKICPWLTAEVAHEVGQIIDSREILTEIIKQIIRERAEAYAGYSEYEAVYEGEEEEGGEEIADTILNEIIDSASCQQL